LSAAFDLDLDPDSPLTVVEGRNKHKAAPPFAVFEGWGF